MNSPLSQEERDELERRKAERKESLRKQGIYARIFFSYLVTTDVDYISDLLEDYQLERLSSSFWNSVTIEKRNFGRVIEFQINFKSRPFGGLAGYVRVKPKPNTVSIVTIGNYSEPTYDQNFQLDVEGYFLAVDELQKLADHFRKCLSDSMSWITPSESNLRRRPPGRPHNPEDTRAVYRLCAGEDPDQVKQDWDGERGSSLVDPKRQWSRIKKKAKDKTMQ